MKIIGHIGYVSNVIEYWDSPLWMTRKKFYVDWLDIKRFEINYHFSNLSINFLIFVFFVHIRCEPQFEISALFSNLTLWASSWCKDLVNLILYLSSNKQILQAFPVFKYIPLYKVSTEYPFTHSYTKLKQKFMGTWHDCIPIVHTNVRMELLKTLHNGVQLWDEVQSELEYYRAIIIN